MSEFDEFDEIFRDLRRFLQPVAAENEIDPEIFANIPQLEMDEGQVVEDELIIGDDDVTYLLYATGRDLEDFSIVVREQELEMKTEDFTLKKPLKFRVDTENSSATCRNGVLSVKLRRLK